MNEQTEERKRRRGFGLWMLLSLAVFVAVGLLAALALSGRQIEAPDWVRDRVERTLGESLAGGDISVGSIKMKMNADWSPVIRLHDIALTDISNLPIASFEELEVVLAAAPIVRGKILPVSVDIKGASLSLRREPDGRFDLSLENTGGGMDSTGSMADLLDSIDLIFEVPQLASIKSVRAEGVTFEYEDVRSARYWVATGGAMELDQDSEKLELRMGFQLLYGQDTPAQAALSFTSIKGSPEATLAANIRDMPAADFSSQSPALAWLSVIDAPVSGAVRAEIDDQGELAGMNGTLEIGTGVLQPRQETRAIGFNSGRAYFEYQPQTGKVIFNELAVSTDAATLRGDGRVYLRDIVNGWPSALLGQFSITSLLANPQDIFDDEVEFNGGALDFRLKLDPFSVQIGQLALFDGETNIRATGDIAADLEGWDVAIDLEADAVSPERLLALWPKPAVPNTRSWLVENVKEGLINNVTGALRISPKKTPRISLGFAFDQAVVRFMNTLPPITNGTGFATIDNQSFTLTVEQGIVTAPGAGDLNVAGSTIQVTDIQAEPTFMDIVLQAKGDIPSALSLLDEPPFEFLSKAGQPTDLATGSAWITANISLPLIKEIDFPDVTYDVRATLRDVQSATLVPDKILASDRLDVRATSDGLEIAGSGQLGAVAFRGAWSQAFGPEGRGKSQVDAVVELSQNFVDEFSLGLPPGSVSGQGEGDVTVNFVQGEAPNFALTSTLNGVGLRLSDLGWSKPANSSGNLEVAGTIGTPAQVDTLSISASGLSATGTVTLKEDGSLDRAQFSRVRVGQWLDGPVALVGRGSNQAPSVRVEGGKIDLRQTNFGRGGGSSRGGPISLALDQLIVSEGITLTGLRGDFTKQPAFKGQFTARVNGEAEIRGVLAPQNGGTAIRVQSDDAGATLRSAGVIDKAHGGEFELILVPRAQEGTYDGRMTTGQIRMRGAPALADMLGAISVVGLLEQLNGQGIVFGNSEVDLRLTPNQVIIKRGSAVGPSLGVSMDGVFDLRTKRMDMQGVISPIYLLNGIGALFTRRGEGLFGFNYTLRGAPDDPQVAVNPLSILTPGMFREIFRRPPPQVSE